MADSLTYEKVLELIAEAHRRSNEELDRRIEKSRKNLEDELKRSTKKFEDELKESRKEFEDERERRRKELEGERERRRKELEGERERRRKELEDDLDRRSKKFDAELEKSRKEFDERMRKLDGKFGNILGSFVEGLVEPKLLELFKNRGIFVTEIYHNVEIHGKGFDGAEIDLLLANSNYSVAVEVKTTLSVDDVREHLSRLDKLMKNPIRIVKNTTLLGAVAGMRIAGHADKFAYRKGLFVLKQKGEIVEIANDEKFRPKEWKIK